MLARGDLIPHFTVTTIDGTRIEYRTLWQHTNLLLISIDDDRSPAAAAYLQWLADARGDLTAYDTALVITRDVIVGVPRPGFVIADRWGEVHFVEERSTLADLPPVSELVESLRFVQVQCPECQGEAR